MKRFLYTLIGAVALFGMNAAHADFYAGAGYGIGFNGGSAHFNDDRGRYKESSVYSAFGGYTLPLPLLDIRGEVEYIRSRPGVKGQHSRRLDAAMASVSGVIPFVPLFDPYVGVGLGYARYDHNNTTAWQYQAGIEYKFVTVPLAMGAEYRYLKLTESCGKRADFSKYHTNTVMIKARYMF